MGYGDHLMAIGAASRQHCLDAQRRPVAIGDGRRVDGRYPELRHGLDFLATQAMVDAGRPLTWLISYQGHRPYHDHAGMAAEWASRHPWRRRLLGLPPMRKLSDRLGHYLFDPAHRAVPAPLVLDAKEEALAAEWSSRQPFVVIEPHIKGRAEPSKRWPFDRFEAVARRLRADIEVYQAGAPDSPPLAGLPRLPTGTFRAVLPFLKAARLYIGPEGGLHHASAAMGTPAVVIFGGYTPPAVTGYDFHINLTGGAEACGTRRTLCPHCVEAMDRIGVDDVLLHARRLLELGSPCHDRRPRGAPAAPASTPAGSELRRDRQAASIK